MPKPARLKVIGYLRVSTAEQTDGYGLDVQEAAIRRYCKAEGLRLVATESDEGQSGSNGLNDRVGLGTALAAIERGDATALVVAKYDRLARDLVLQETVIGRLEATGHQVLSVSEPRMDDADDATRVLIRQVMGAFGQYEKALIRGRMMAGKAQKVARGGYGGGRPAYGLMAQGAELVPNPDESAVVDAVTSLRAAGASYRAIAKALADAGQVTRSGGTWDPAQVRRIAQRTGS
jgi:DNA invertase Pin-like site-specific DNA recombinase